MERIHFKIIELKHERPKEMLQAYISIDSNRIEQKMECITDKYDDEMGVWKEDVYTYFHQVAEKSSVTGFYIDYREGVNQWKVSIIAASFSEDWYIIFDNEEKAKALFNKLMAWKFYDYKVS